MPEKRRTRSAVGQARALRPTAQTTLKDLFRKTKSDNAPATKEQDLCPEHADPVAPSLQAADPRPSRPPKPSQLFPIFTRTSSVREKSPDAVINVDDAEVIDITGMPSDVELSTEPSIRQLSPHPESIRAASQSPPRSPVHLDVHRSSNTSFPHVGTHGNTRPRETNTELHKRTLLGDVAPLPSSCSQHVRGVQHSYTRCPILLKRSAFPSCGPSDEGKLDFLATWRRLDDAPLAPLDGIHGSLTLGQCEEYLQSLGRRRMKSRPAFERVSVHRERTSVCHAEMWTRRFRPRRANEVLGNERHALYLRDWLRALELHLQGCNPEEPASKGGVARGSEVKGTSKRAGPRGAKRPRVIRAVAKKRGNKRRRVDSDDDLDDFVVFSDTDEEQADDSAEDSEDEVTFCQRTLARLQGRNTIDAHDTHPDATNVADTETEHTIPRLQEPVRTNFSDNLTNTLLITGPSGCGKTAAVYACAEELGWEIFEVYPGVGKRNGASLEHLVGDVGRNHIVQTVRRRALRKTAKRGTKEGIGLGGYLVNGKTGKFAGFGKSEEASTERQPISVEGDGPRDGPQPLPRGQDVDTSERGRHTESDGSRRIVRQSLVLLEEVDILFKEDAGFWPAVVDFIRCCQRPVVMTCNDPGLVPVGDLPLQSVLVFEPCPASVAASFLQCVSLTAGWLVPHEDLMDLYEGRGSEYGLDVPEGGGYPRAEGGGVPDLRRSITQLQMVCAGARHGSATEMHQGDEASGRVRRSGGAISDAERVAPTGGKVGGEWWRRMRRESELMSHVDGELCRTWTGTVEVASECAEMGYSVLEGEVRWGHDGLIAEEAMRRARGLGGTGPSEASIGALEGARVVHRSRTVAALEAVVERAVPVMAQASVWLDYVGTSTSSHVSTFS